MVVVITGDVPPGASGEIGNTVDGWMLKGGVSEFKVI